MKRAVGLASAFLLAINLSPTSTTSANTIQEHWKSPTPTKSGQIGIFYDDRELYGNSLGLYAGVSRDGKTYSENCDSITDIDCTSAVKFSFAALLPPCNTTFITNCILEFYGIDAQGIKRTATFKKYVSEDPKDQWNGGGPDRVPNSRSESIWQLEGLSNTAASEFVLSAMVVGSYRPKKSDLFIDRLSGTISAVKGIERIGRTRSVSSSSEATFGESSLFLSDAENSYWSGGFNWQAPDDCAAVAKDLCYQRQPMPKGLSLGMKVRLAKPVVGWIHGRFKAPQVEITKDGTDQIIDVRGESIEIPVVGGYFEESKVSKTIWEEFQKHPYGTTGTPDGGTARRVQGFYPLDNILPLTRLGMYLDLFDDQASATPSTWMFASVEYRGLEESLRKLGAGSKCVLDNPSVSGIVATNATSYLGAVPEYVESEGALNYRVAAPHYDTNRKEFLGTYDLVMDSKVARCIYKFTDAPIKASVEIVAADAGNRVASTVLNEKNGWLTLGAYGFTYSSPTIKVTLSQEKPAVPSPLSSPSPAPSASTTSMGTTKVSEDKKSNRSTITCLKGSVKKKVTAINPKCPKGYKKA